MPYLSVGLLSASGSDPERLWPLKVEGLRTLFRFSPSPCRGAIRLYKTVLGFPLQLL